MTKKRKFNYINLLLILVFIAGLGILLYPNISNYFNEKNSSKANAEYDETVAQMREEDRQAMISGATSYNETLLNDPVGRFSDFTEEQKAEYMSQLNVDGKGMMCYLKIDKLGVNLPVYHGTDESVLQHYVGHVEGTSLPVGGLGTHCALSGHRGLPSAVLFTNLDRMEVGDSFSIIVLGEEHVYVVDQIETVLPDDLSLLEIDPQKDYCTLITCTPYGVNTHRLMVRGVRVPDADVDAVKDAGSDGRKGFFDFTREQIVNIIAAVMAGVFFLVLVPLLVFVPVPAHKAYLRPWDDNIEKVFKAAIAIAENSTRANWATENVTQMADSLSKLRRWDDTATEKNTLSDEDDRRPFNDYRYEEDGGSHAKHENSEEETRSWDDDILEKVDQDWEPFERERCKQQILFTDVEDIVKRGSLEKPEEDLKPYFEKELSIGREILKKSRKGGL